MVTRRGRKGPNRSVVGSDSGMRDKKQGGWWNVVHASVEIESRGEERAEAGDAEGNGKHTNVGAVARPDVVKT